MLVALSRKENNFSSIWRNAGYFRGMSPHPLSPLAVSIIISFQCILILLYQCIVLLSPTYTPFTNALFVPSYLYSLHQCIVCSASPILPSPMHCLLSLTYTPFTNALFGQPHLYSLHQCIVCSVLPILPSPMHCLFHPTSPMH